VATVLIDEVVVGVETGVRGRGYERTF